MPIYAYKCQSCGFAKDVLQKISDQPLSLCPSCSAETFAKQLTAAGFQLKGSGWYATDFKGGPKSAPGADGDKGDKADTSDKGGAKSGEKSGENGGDKSSGTADGRASDKGGKTESKPADGATAKKSDTPVAAGSGS